MGAAFKPVVITAINFELCLTDILYNPYGNEKREVKILETQKRDMTKFRFQGEIKKFRSVPERTFTELVHYQ
ncbi:Uncharacterised protein [Escherichia coli]|uniref:Uncharacterized protein n=1 Tax=Escherichia coli TaxID=562 RepID=A0A376LGT8_ECOLX|nr:Uncharacterised protein [Escherichia coli]